MPIAPGALWSRGSGEWSSAAEEHRDSGSGEAAQACAGELPWARPVDPVAGADASTAVPVATTTTEDITPDLGTVPPAVKKRTKLYAWIGAGVAAALVAGGAVAILTAIRLVA